MLAHLQKLQLHIPLHLGQIQSSFPSASSAFSPYLRKPDQPKVEKETARAENKWRVTIYLLRRHLRQYLIGHGPFFLTCLHAAAKSIVFWRHCRRGNNSSEAIYTPQMRSQKQGRIRRKSMLAHLVAGLAIIWIVDPAANNPDFGHRVALLSIHLRQYHLQRLRLQHLNTLW